MVGVRAKNHDEKRQLILERAAELFAKQGFSRTTINEISAACNASKAWVYHYYSTKEEILFELLRDFLEMVVRRVGEAIAEQPTPQQRLRSFIRECLQIYDEYRINYPLLFNDKIFLKEEDQKTIVKIERQYARMLRDTLVAINPNIAIREAEVMPITLLAFGTMNWTYTWFNPDGPLPLEKICDLTEHILLHGISSINRT